MSVVSVDELFSNTEVARTGSANWYDPIPEAGPGVYVISIADPSLVALESLHERDRHNWIPDQPIIYIGRSVHLSRRLGEFYRHEYGKPAPHRGGEAILNVGVIKRVDWAALALGEHAKAEHDLIEAFVAKVGRRPFGNRVRSARFAKTAD
jgi:hypothetical protein